MDAACDAERTAETVSISCQTSLAACECSVQTDEDPVARETTLRAERYRQQAHESWAKAQEQIRNMGKELQSSRSQGATLLMEVEALRDTHSEQVAQITSLTKTMQAKVSESDQRFTAQEEEWDRMCRLLEQRVEFKKRESDGLRGEKNELAWLLKDTQHQYMSLHKVIEERPQHDNTQVMRLQLKEKVLLQLVDEKNEELNVHKEERKQYAIVQSSLDENQNDLNKLSRSVSREKAENDLMREKLADVQNEFRELEKTARESEQKLKVLCKNECEAKKTLLKLHQTKAKENATQVEESESWKEKHKVLVKEHTRLR